MNVSLSAKIRAALYVFTAVGTPIVTYLLDRGIIGSGELALWGAEVTVISAMAGFKALSPDAPVPGNGD